MSKFLTAGALLLLLAACKSDDDEDSGGDPVQACEDTADAVAKAFERCGSDYQATRDEFIKSATGGKDCSAVAKVRDEESLRGTCIPSLSTVSCADLGAAKLDDSCKSQLQRPQ